MESSEHTYSPPTAGGYEFSAAENVTIAGTARWVGIFAWFGIIAGILMAIAGIFTIPAGLVNVVVGAVYIVIGVWFRGAAKSLQSVVTTEGDDIAHLMTALGNLRSAFMAMVIIIALGIALAILVSILVAGAAVAMGGA